MFLGVDIGTTGVKTCIVDLDGNICSKAYNKFNMYGLNEGKRELNPQEIFDGVKQTIHGVIKNRFAQPIQLITISSLGEAIVPLDRNGKVLMNSILGTDRRGSKELQWVKNQFSDNEITRITGLNLSSIYSLNKILYIKNNRPEIYRNTWKFFCIADYIVFNLTGKACIDYSLASRTMAFDYNEYKWSKAILKKCDISLELFPTAVPSGTVIGTIHNNISKELGLPLNIKVAIGAHDHIFNSIGSGAVHMSTCSNAVGTTEGLTVYLGKDRLDINTIVNNNISCEPFVLPKTFNTVAWHNTAGALLNWFVKIFFNGKEKCKSNAILKNMDGVCNRAPSHLMVLPYFAGSTTRYMDDKAKGAIIGLNLSTTKEEIYKALLEGSTYELMIIFQAITKAGIDIDCIVVSGGGSKSRIWLETKADILGKEITTVACTETGALGSAVLASVKCGYYRTISEATEAMVKYKEIIYPNEKFHTLYRERFQEYQGLYDSLKSANHML